MTRRLETTCQSGRFISCDNPLLKQLLQLAHIKQRMRDKLNEHTQHIHEYGEDMPEIRHWKWPEAKA